MIEGVKYKVFADCIGVSGYSRSVIVDFYNYKFEYIPTFILKVISKKYLELSELKNDFGGEVSDIIKEYIVYLVSKNYVFACPHELINNFPSIDMRFSIPFKIQNAIIEIKDNKCYFEKVISDINKMYCGHLQIKWYSKVKISEINACLKKVELNSLRSIDIVFPDFVELQLQDIRLLLESYDKISRIFITQIRESSEIQISDSIEKVVLVRNVVNSSDCCGNILSQSFNINLTSFTESQNHNTCLNRKICIDSDGYIKNCPSMKHHYGHISDTTLAEAIEKPGFKDCWFIKKDDIDVCQDCEFRHICTDCRAFIKDPNNIYSQPAKCGYNPYIAKWQNEEGWISVEQWRTENPGWEEQAIELRELNKKFVDSNNE
ncbi:MAG: grasp-with-spasm system SPASM domain peptide maturase [Bacteroidales bacterium]|nr:grasp-with-spasm system SPASM domain peptide maturase [Bacteroidales bacterium]